MLCACARFARSLMSSLSHSLFCLALALLRLCSLCACSRSVRSLEVFLFLSCFALLLVAPACLLHVHSKKIVSHSLCLALALRLHSLCALAQDYSLTLYALALGRTRVFSARSLENYSLDSLCLSLALRLRSHCALAHGLSLAFALLPFACSAALALALRVLSLCHLIASPS